MDVSNNTYDSVSLNLSAKENNARTIAFGDSGSKMYIMGRQTDKINQYNLSTPYDLSTAADASKSLTVSTTEEGFCLSQDGTKCYTTRTDGTVNEYTLSTAWDISTASSIQSASLISTPGGIAINDDGSKLFITQQNSPQSIYEYALSTNYDLSTASYTTDYDTDGDGAAAPDDLYMALNGTTYIIVDSDDHAYQYSMSTAFDVSTSSFVGFFSVASQTTSARGIAFRDDLTKMYLYSSTGYIYQYTTDHIPEDGDYYWPFDGSLEATRYITQAGSTFVEQPGPTFFSSSGAGHAGDGGKNVQTHESTLSATISPVTYFDSDMSVSFWVQLSDPSTSFDIIRISGISTSSSETENEIMVLNKNGSTLTYSHEYGSGNSESSTMTGTINFTTVYHIAIVRDDSAKTVKLYIDGSLSDTFNYTNSPTNTNSGVTVTIGHGVANCEYDDLKIWGSAIDSATVTTESTPDSPTQSVILANTDTVAYWLMTEAYTATVADQVGNYDGTWSGIDATEDQATDILGDGDAVITLSSGYGGFTASTPISTPQTSDYSFTVFVKFASLTNAVLMEINGGSTNNTVLEVTSGGVIQLTRNSTTVATASSTVTTGILYMIGVTEGTTNTTLYVNGIQEKQDTRPGGTGTCTTVEVGSIDSGTHSYSMGHAAFFDQELTAADIIDVYTSAPNTPDDVVDLGLISYWKFDESSGTNLTDAAGSNDLTLSGTYNLAQTSVSTWGTTYAINFTDAGATVSSSELIDFGTGDFSFFVWIKPSGIGDAERQHIFSSVGSQSAQTVNDLLTLTQLTAEPTTGDGVVAFADGTSWNPGSGEGIYAYYNSTWNKLG